MANASMFSDERAYQSQRENREDLEARRANKLRARLGWKAGIGGRLKRMQWTMYWQLKERHDAQSAQTVAGIWASRGRQATGVHQI